MKTISTLFSITILTIFTLTPIHSEVFEEIYAVINDEILTHSEFQNARNAMVAQLQSRYEGEELNKAMKDIDKKIISQLIEYKLILSRAKEKKYDVENEVNMIIEEIKKQNNLKTTDDLRTALQSEGITLEEFKKQQATLRMQQRMIYEEVTSKIKIDNAELMEYYKENIADYTNPLELTLNCIYLNKEFYFDQNALQTKRNEIDSLISQENFEEIARKYSELEGTENNFVLGTFKQKELDERIEKAALNLSINGYSPWIETEKGWYIVQLINKTEAKAQDFKEVREKIMTAIMQHKQEVALRNLVDQLKKESHIKIYKQID